MEKSNDIIIISMYDSLFDPTIITVGIFSHSSLS